MQQMPREWNGSVAALLVRRVRREMAFSFNGVYNSCIIIMLFEYGIHLITPKR